MIIEFSSDRIKRIYQMINTTILLPFYHLFLPTVTLINIEYTQDGRLVQYSELLIHISSFLVLSPQIFRLKHSEVQAFLLHCLNTFCETDEIVHVETQGIEGNAISVT